jgi:hypothetical protein
MIAVDTNIMGIAWQCLYEFVAIVAHPRIHDTQTPLEDALLQAEAWLESPPCASITARSFSTRPIGIFRVSKRLPCGTPYDLL